MESNEKEVRTEIAEEHEAQPVKRGKRVWLIIGVGGVLFIIALVALIVAVRKPQLQLPRLTTEEQEQLKYDSEQKEREKQKADLIRDQSLLVRKDDNNQAQLNNLLKDLELEKDSGSSLPTPVADQQTKSEEEAISHVLKSSNVAKAQAEPSYQPQRKQPQSKQTTVEPNMGTNPMFVYSRSFGGAKYVDSPQKQNSQPLQVATEKNKSGDPKSAAPSGEKPVDENVRLIYTNYPPVTLYEGEMLEAVLVNRIIADTEPSPVICQVSKDVFDYSAHYVVIPASSRIVGQSQVVNYKGASRLFVTFQRIIFPHGPSIDLPSNQKALKALDETGALGVVSKVDRHWFMQFGTAIFFGVLDGLSGVAQRNKDVFSTQSAVLGKTSESFDRILENIMSQYSSIVPTIRVDQGKTMKIYLSGDILISPYAKISERSYANR